MKKVAAVVFDLDGTLTVPCLDFDAMREEIGGIKGTILEAIAHMSDAEKARVETILQRHEDVAAENSELNPGTSELLKKLREEKRGIAILTRNCHRSVKRIAEIHNLTFDAVITREDGPAKPDPYGVLELCKQLNVQPSETLVVGDYVYDLMAGRRAGAKSVLISTSTEYTNFICEADYVIDHLEELNGIISEIESD